jgi:hypothetical protein
MQAVDQIDQLMQFFSLAGRHKFKKWYKQFAMALFDMWLVNSDVHFHLRHPKKKQQNYHRYIYHNALGNALIATNWTEYMQIEEFKLNKFANDHGNRVSEDVRVLQGLGIDTNDNNSVSSDMNALSSLSSGACIPSCVGVAHETAKPSVVQRCCQICLFEGRGRVWKNVAYCATHRMKACVQIQPDKSVEKMYFCARKGKRIKCTDWTWMCSDKHLSCWDKFHSFYLPAGVFHTHATSKDGDNLIFV